MSIPYYGDVTTFLGVVPNYKKFNDDFQPYIYDIEEEDEYLSAWKGMLAKYGLHENEWLQKWF
jgi:hypothetical protein